MFRPDPCVQEVPLTPLSVMLRMGLLCGVTGNQEGCATQVDIFSETAILERFKGKPGMCQLLDYGLDGDDFIMVLRHYAGSLKAWRDQMPGCPDGQLRRYLQIFGEVVSGVQVRAHLPAGIACRTAIRASTCP